MPVSESATRRWLGLLGRLGALPISFVLTSR
jgi:hypothetical protein